MNEIQYDIYGSLKKVLPTTPSWVIIHSSLYHLQLHTSELKWNFLRAVKMLVNDGYTLAFPSFTFSFLNNGYFDRQTSTSETGVLADWVNLLYDALRTDHPVYSHVVIGSESSEAERLCSNSCFGSGSIYELFENKHATVVMMGCGWEFCTPFHYFEELAQVSYRYNKHFYSKSNKEQMAVMYVRDFRINPENDFTPAIEVLDKKGQIKYALLGKGSVESVDFINLADTCSKLLRADPYCFVREPLKVKKLVANKLSTQNNKLSIAILGESNIDILVKRFEEQAQKSLAEYNVTFHTNEYGQMQKSLVSGKIENWSVDFAFLPNRLEDIYQVQSVDLIDYNNTKLLEQYLEFVVEVVPLIRRKVFVHIFNLSEELSTGPVYFAGKNGPIDFCRKANEMLFKIAEKHHNLRLISPEVMCGCYPKSDPRLWYLGRIPFTEEINRCIVPAYCGMILNDLGRTARILALDLDNTLWGGVLGEDGIKGIHLGGDFPGNAFKDFQKTILKLKQRGIALAVVSKNDEDLVLSTLAEHPDMLIKENDLAAYRINWNEKSISIREIAGELSIGLSNVVFIDDNPLECEKVRQNLPDVAVIELPDDPALYRKVVLESPSLGLSDLTGEDMKRADNYVKARIFENEKIKYKDVESYFESLDIKVKIDKINSLNFARVLQLVNKTNQFNTTTKRYDELELKMLSSSRQHFVGVIGYCDKMTEFEYIGVFVTEVISEILKIDNFLLSCRILGRGIETAALSWIFEHAREMGCCNVHGRIIDTQRNTPVRDLFEKADFDFDVKYNRWVKHVDQSVKVPNWIRLEGPRYE